MKIIIFVFGGVIQCIKTDTPSLEEVEVDVLDIDNINVKKTIEDERIEKEYNNLKYYIY